MPMSKDYSRFKVLKVFENKFRKIKLSNALENLHKILQATTCCAVSSSCLDVDREWS